ncbi:MAG TPA: DUF4118 domain-containing protein [Propionicimonas sp.]|jgi:hypothetical protein|nr:DUF4118 domain-containing protein [Propionicimonas sp.]
MLTDWLERNRTRTRVLAVVLPLVAAWLLYLVAEVVGAPAAALVLVLLVVAGAATGDRPTGILAGLASAAGFDFFLTEPFLDFHIADAGDIELAVLLLLVGLAVNELALWGGRQRAAASRREGFIEGVLEAAGLPGAGASVPTPDGVAERVRTTLGAERVRYRDGLPDADAAVVGRDGSVTWAGLTLDVTRSGLPIDRVTAVPVLRHDQPLGWFEVTTATREVRPDAEQLRVALLLADQVGRWEPDRG